MAGGYSFQTGKIPEFNIADYVVFGVLLGLSASIGLYYAIKDKIQKKQNTTEFMLGGRTMSVFPVAMSLTVTFLSALTILGNPAEVYNYNTMFLYITVAMIISMLAAGTIFVPFFFELGITSVFQEEYMLANSGSHNSEPLLTISVSAGSLVLTVTAVIIMNMAV